MPSEKTLSAKKERVAQLVEMLKNAAAGVLVDYKGITVEEDTKLRKELRGWRKFISLEEHYPEICNQLVLTVSQTSEGPPAPSNDQTAPFSFRMQDEKFFLKAGYIGEDVYDEAEAL